jgi:hypothetical protein
MYLQKHSAWKITLFVNVAAPIQWHCGLSHKFAVAHLLGLRVRISPEHRCLSLVRVCATEQIPLPEELYRVCVFAIEHDQVQQ